MQQPFEPPAEEMPSRSEPAARADEIVAALDPSITRSVNNEGPLREIAHAFRLNAEALHTLKQMQGDLARQVRRGDRSELVVQSTRALNDTFRNLSSVQQELLRRIREGQGRSRSSAVPLMLIGLLVVLLGGIYVILDALDRRGPADPELAPSEVARRERAAWKEGRTDGAAQAEREIQRLQASLQEGKNRSAQLQDELDAKQKRLAELDQRKRTVEVERDDFASQVRKAQSEMMAKQVLEEEVASLRLQIEAANRAAADAEHDLELERKKSAGLRERVASDAMGFSPDDPPWHPGQPAPTSESDADALPGSRKPKPSNSELLRAYQEKMRKLRGDAIEDSSVPPAAYVVDDTPTPARPPVPEHPAPQHPAPKGAAYGGDGPGTLPPPSIRRRGEPEPAPTRPGGAAGKLQTVQGRVNALLQRSDTLQGSGWRLARVGGLTPGGLTGVTLVRYDAGKVAERVEARSLQIDVDRTGGRVEFAMRDGTRYALGQQQVLPEAGSRIVVARDEQARAWARADLGVARTR